MGLDLGGGKRVDEPFSLSHLEDPWSGMKLVLIHLEHKIKEKRPRSYFMPDGRPMNINESKIDFKLTDDDNCFILDMKLYKYLDSSLINVDIQPKYVRVLIKGKVFQLSLGMEISQTRSTCQRSKTSGYLSITMPKVIFNSEYFVSAKIS
ncbi:protein tilB homolog [Octopus sinensis]|uniref:Protein tilB homolog n=1 Tax=Octopus sinensis TaxID=2607531 RepID=A0A6P7U0M0_9MOLL|nr:protein tilB homolog [Octopus sinensis]